MKKTQTLFIDFLFLTATAFAMFYRIEYFSEKYHDIGTAPGTVLFLPEAAVPNFTKRFVKFALQAFIAVLAASAVLFHAAFAFSIAYNCVPNKARRKVRT